MLLAATSPEGVNGGLTVVAIDPITGTPTTVGTWDAVDGQPLAWLGGMDDAFSPDRRWLWTLGQPSGTTDQSGYVIDLVDGGIRLLEPPDGQVAGADWVSAGTLGTWPGDLLVARSQAIDPASGIATELAVLPKGTWVVWAP